MWSRRCPVTLAIFLLAFAVLSPAFAAEAESFVVPAGGGTITLQGGDVQILCSSGVVPADTQAYIARNKLAPRGAGYVNDATFSISRPELTFAAGKAQLSIKFEPNNVPANATQSSVHMYHLVSHRWLLVSGSIVDTVSHVVRANVAGAGTYGLFGSSLYVIPSDGSILADIGQNDGSLDIVRFPFLDPIVAPTRVQTFLDYSPWTMLNGAENCQYYWSSVDGGYDLFVANIDGSKPKRITFANTAAIPSLSTSGDGKKLLVCYPTVCFLSNADSSGSVVVAQSNGTPLIGAALNGAGTQAATATATSITVTDQMGNVLHDYNIANSGQLSYNLAGTYLALSGSDYKPRTMAVATGALSIRWNSPLYSPPVFSFDGSQLLAYSGGTLITVAAFGAVRSTSDTNVNGLGWYVWR